MANDKLTITLTDRAPVTIIKAEWHVIASAKDWDNEHESQATRTWRLTVREHSDGRTIVSGHYSTAYRSERDARAGEIVPANDDTTYDYLAPIIRRVAAACECERIAAACIADLPATEV